MDVSVIIVNYNTKQLLTDCLRSIYERTKGIDFEVIVSDNGSADGSIEMIKADFPQVVLLENNENLGFGKANNVAAKIANGKYLFFLNSDTLLLNNAVKLFFDEAEKINSGEKKVFLGCLLCDEVGNVVHSYEKFTPPAKGVFRCVIQTYPVLSKLSAFCRRKKAQFRHFSNINEKDVQFIIGADLFCLSSDFMKINGFDEQFFMFFEDDDLCRRASDCGIKCRIISEPKIVHLESRSTKVKSRKIQFFEKSFLIYAGRYYSIFASMEIRLFFIIYSVFRIFDFRFTIRERFEMLNNILR